MWEKFKKHWIKWLSFFVATIIPLVAWFGGFVPTFVVAQDLEQLNSVYEKRINELNVGHMNLAIEFKRSEREDLEQDRLRLEREIFQVEQQNEEVPPFYIEQRLRYEQEIERLNEDINDLRNYKFNMEGLRSQ